MTTATEAARAALLRKSRRQRQLTTTGTGQEKLEQTREELEFYKEKLRRLLEFSIADDEKNERRAEIAQLTKLLLELRARLALAALQARHEEKSLDDETLAGALTSFYRDCHKLTAAVSSAR